MQATSNAAQAGWFAGRTQWDFCHGLLGASRPVSRVLSGAIIHLGPPSPAASSSIPGGACGPTHSLPIRLAPNGVYPAAAVASRAVRSYRTFSPLPGAAMGARRYIFCGTFRELAPPRRYLASRPPEPGLSSRRPGKTRAASDCLAGLPKATVVESALARNTHRRLAPLFPGMLQGAQSPKAMSTTKESWSLASLSMRITEAAETLSKRNLLSST